jgi:GNAT superfamily N-acetyltransferase
MISITRCNSENSDFKSLIRKLDADLDGRYGLLQQEYDNYNKIASLETVVVAYDKNIPVGCGCFKEYSSSVAEIKRMFVLPEYRGRGIAASILTELENWGKEKNFTKTILETGIKQYEAIGLYTKLGYKKIDNFGQYQGNTNSICMEKLLP